jgi:predicted DNA-binding ribbon-helix-helix protein
MTKPALRSTDSFVKKRSIVIGNHKTSISLEDEFWEGHRHIAQLRQTKLADHVSVIDGERGRANLSSAIRMFVLEYYRSRAAAPDARRRSVESNPTADEAA